MADSHGAPGTRTQRPHPKSLECPFIRPLVSPLRKFHTQTPLERPDLHNHLPPSLKATAALPTAPPAGPVQRPPNPDDRTHSSSPVPTRLVFRSAGRAPWGADRPGNRRNP